MWKSLCGFQFSILVTKQQSCLFSCSFKFTINGISHSRKRISTIDPQFQCKHGIQLWHVVWDRERHSFLKKRKVVIYFLREKWLGPLFYGDRKPYLIFSISPAAAEILNVYRLLSSSPTLPKISHRMRVKVTIFCFFTFMWL